MMMGFIVFGSFIVGAGFACLMHENIAPGVVRWSWERNAGLTALGVVIVVASLALQ